MLVFFGEPLPLFKDGEEVVPVAWKDDSFGNEETPFIKVMLKEHDGVRADRPFDVTPRQQVCHVSPFSNESDVCPNNLSYVNEPRHPQSCLKVTNSAPKSIT